MPSLTRLSDESPSTVSPMKPNHSDWLLQEAQRNMRYFDPSLRQDHGFDVLDLEGQPLPRAGQELHTTTRLVHSHVLGQAIGHASSDAMIDAGMHFLWNSHRDTKNGGYVWSVDETGIHDDKKLAYGHVFVLLAASSAKQAGHPDADRLLADVAEAIDTHFWDEDAGCLHDEFTRDWQVFSDYRGMNANMHGVEAMLAAYEATGESVWLTRAGRVLDFFIGKMAADNDWRVPEHYKSDWSVDRAYSGNPMFRPAGTTPGHSFEFARLTLQHWDLAGRPEGDAMARARGLTDRAAADAWMPDGGIAYTLNFDGSVSIPDRYWWPVTEAIGAYAALMFADPSAPTLAADEAWYAKLWLFAEAHFIDNERGGWFPEIDPAGKPTGRQFHGKPDLYHALQAALYPASGVLSGHLAALKAR